MDDEPVDKPEGVVPFAIGRDMTAWISWQDGERLRALGAWRPHVLPHTTYALTDMWKVHPETGREYRGTISMHRFLAGNPPGLTVDHRNRNGLHNWRENLMAVPHGVNMANRTTPKGEAGYWGVSTTRNGLWRARLTIYGQRGVKPKRTYLGTFATAEEAARARDRAVLERYGPYVPLNFPASDYGYDAPATLPLSEVPF